MENSTLPKGRRIRIPGKDQVVLRIAPVFIALSPAHDYLPRSKPSELDSRGNKQHILSLELHGVGVHTLKETEKTYGPWEPGKPSAEEAYKKACEAASGECSRRATRVSHSSTCDTNHMKEAQRSLPSKLPKQADTGQGGAQDGHKHTLQYTGRRGMSELQQADRKS